jgi:hypothetical protein
LPRHGRLSPVSVDVDDVVHVPSVFGRSDAKLMPVHRTFATR